MNPSYDSKELGWEQAGLSQDDLSYEFNDLLFWRTPKGIVYTANDSGCSCPTPFENYCGKTAEEIEQKLERVGSFKQACATIKSWNGYGVTSGWRTNPFCPQEDVDKLEDTLRGWFKRG
jgi:hypothetical protein